MKKSELITLIKEVLNEEDVFIPRNIEGRKERRLQQIYQFLNQEIIDGDLILKNLPIEHLGKVKIVTGNVKIYKCPNLKNLGNFERTGGDFYCFSNNLTLLQGAPKEVGGDFDCYNNNLTSLQGAPKEVGGNFYCSYNNLTSLQGAPSKVGGDFNCSSNNLTSLQGAPSKVGGDFNCSSNNLTSLQYAPSKVGGNFYCSYNNLTSLQGAPKEIGGDFYCYNNKKQFIKDEVRKVSDVRGKIIV